MSNLRWSERAMKVRAEHAMQTLDGQSTPHVRQLALAEDVLTLLARVERMRACIEPATQSVRSPIDENAEEILSELIRITTGRTPKAGELLDVTLALLRAHPTIARRVIVASRPRRCS